jgi:energy-coupling factor transport system ATP-binding protein
MMHRAGEQPLAVCMEQVSYCRSKQDRPVLSGISLSIPAGQWVCIAGPNGAGKSTLAKLMNGLMPATEGRIEIEGTSLDADTLWAIRRRIGVVFANPEDQFVGLSVEDDLAFGLENIQMNRDDMRQRIADYAQLMKIESWLGRHPSTLSGGQKQRVAIASVLATEPSILIFDEAMSMLDERSKLDMLSLMREMKESGRYTLISISHDGDEIAAADRMLVVADGGIVADGSPDELLRDDELLQLCRMQQPFPLQLCKALKLQGIDIGEHIREEEVLDALWAYHSSK